MNNNFCLALGGGALRGLAHIGVIKRLEELGVKPTEISGTSMGAIIGALYASGMTSEEMIKIAEDTKFIKLLDFDLKNGLLKGNKIMKYFQKYIGEKTFEELEIPLSIVVTNIDTGEKIVFRKGRIIDAIRASIGIPGIFIPFKHNGMHLVDGGIMENLPIKILNPNYPVIAVSVQMSISKRVRNKKSFLFPNGTMLSNSYGLIRKMVGIMMYQNELNSIETRSDILVIRAEREDIDYYEFNKMKQMIDEGYRISTPIVDFLKNN
ncbi:patatin-like phospholipase family protein [Candidatus Gracilibacteria bacterium]|nr:patatin-like phospholipase family protein [Candidatus Gracilibacteria bacterium]